MLYVTCTGGVFRYWLEICRIYGLEAPSMLELQNKAHTVVIG